MEETLPVGNKETMPPLHTAQYLIPPASPLSPHNNNINNVEKRKQSNVDIHNSAYFKILDLVQQLRPLFIQALQTPDFRKCKPAYEIRKRMNLVMDLYKHMQIKGNPIANYESKSGCQILSAKKRLEKEDSDGLLRPTSVLKKDPEKELPPDLLKSGEKFNSGLALGSYIVGGSVSGWNFITFAHRNPPVFYGVTKESYRLGHNKSCKDNLCLGEGFSSVAGSKELPQ